MSAALAQTRAMTVRHLRELWRQPWFVAIMLVQPLIWLLLFGSLFKRVVEIPGFGGGDYIDFLTPGLVVMTALFSAGWSGMGVIEDLNRGVMDRFLVSPVSRASLIAGRLGSLSLTVAIQSLIVVAIGMAVGARFPGGIVGIAVLVGCAVLLACSVGSLSIGLALVARQEETLIAAVQLVVLPATFLSAGLMAQSLAPGWVQAVARFNPVNWAVEAGRGALGDNVDWGLVGSRAGLLVVILCSAAGSRQGRFARTSGPSDEGGSPLRHRVDEEVRKTVPTCFGLPAGQPEASGRGSVPWVGTARRRTRWRPSTTTRRS